VFELSNEELEELLEQSRSLTDIGALVKKRSILKKPIASPAFLKLFWRAVSQPAPQTCTLSLKRKMCACAIASTACLVDVLTFDHDTYKQILSRLKLLSGLKLNITDEAQDGRFSIKVKGDEIELRTSILPGNYAETLVLRILNPKSIGVPLEELGLEEDLRLRIEKEITKPNGMILTTGPTGSGKTTTLYAFLRKVNSPDTK
jgi:Cdc6-like AAA superfamily ATPase